MPTKSLLEQRIDFTKRFHNWQMWFYNSFQPAHMIEINGSLRPSAEIAIDEGRIITPRKIWLNGKIVKLPDAVHGNLSRGFISRHHEGCAVDVNLYVYDQTKKKFNYIANGSHIYWIEMAAKAKDFGLVNGASWNDINHFSTESPDGRK